MSTHPDMAPYFACMNEIKARYKIANSFNNGERNAIYDVSTMEVMVLQFRMIFELIALSSLSAHARIFEEYHIKFQRKWRVTEIMKDLEQLNPNFYPHPILEVPSATPGIKNDFVDVAEGYLTKSELISAHGQCGNVLHARNPFGKHVDVVHYQSKMNDWSSRIMRLLNAHLIRLLNDQFMYLVHFNALDKPVNLTVFERADT